MRAWRLRAAGIALTIVSASSALLLFSGTPERHAGPISTGHGSVETLLANYRAWEAAYVTNGGDRNLVLALGPARGLVTGASGARGRATLDLIEGTVAVEVRGLPDAGGWEVWLVDSRAGRSVLPEPGDATIRAGRLAQAGDVGRLQATLGRQALADFQVSLVAVTRADKTPAEHRLLVGMTSLFHRLHWSAQHGRFGQLAAAAPAAAAGPLARSWVARAEAQIGPIPNPMTPLEQLITQGRNSFFNETFNGNGRTCGTCHREENNLTIDPEFIATLPPNDPLFVAEFQPALAKNFENPQLQRKLGLILENVDGFDDLQNKFVMRGVPHLLALLQNTLTPNPGDGTTIPPNERVGWGGDGAAGTGTLREAAITAVIQHFPQTLGRVPGVDFRLPTSAELDALEAFQRSLGRREDLDLSTLRFKSPKVDLGRQIFNNPGIILPGGRTDIAAGKCFFCHLNGGASDFFVPGGNSNFNTNVEGLPAQPADLTGQLNPPDGGFGSTGISPTGGIGNGSFNTPVLVEAADTGPFFHNNSISTIEGAVDFYNSRAFNEPPGFGALVGGIKLEATEVEAVAAFLRVINSLENIRSSTDLASRARAANRSQAPELLRLSISELEDAIEVLSGGRLHPEAVGKLSAALGLAAEALDRRGDRRRDRAIDQALALMNAARADLVR